MNGRRPRQSDVLIGVLKNAVDRNVIWPLVADGICACVENAVSLREDLLVLTANRRFPAAQFIYATCMEEIGKALILFDVARIDLAAGFLPHLCRAFYSHAAKFAYARTSACPGRGDLAAALESFRLETIEYWHNPDPTDGEPDLLAAGLYARESALYVDYVEFDGKWFRPADSALPRLYADPAFVGGSGLSSAEKEINTALNPLKLACSESLFCPDALTIISDELSRLFCNAGCDGQVGATLERIGDRLRCGIANISAETLSATFMRLPLYAAIVAPERISRF